MNKSVKKNKTDVFKQTIKEGVDAYQNVLSKNNYSYLKFNLDCSKFVTPTWVKGHPLPKNLDYIFDKLPKHKPCLYYFEILNSDASTILKSYVDFLKKEKPKSKPRVAVALKKAPPLDSSILYVGKVKYDIKGRMMVHFGYYHIGATAGLHLYCWAKAIKLKLKIHIYIFEKEMANFVSPLELPFARNLKPLFGKH